MAAHAGTHKRGGNDPIRLDDLAEPQDNVDLNSNTSRHGLLPKLSGNSTDSLQGNGTWGSGGNAASADHFVTTQAESDLSNEFSLGSLTTGLLKHSVSAGVSTPATASAGTDYVAPGSITSCGLTQATAKLLGRSSASSGAIEEITLGSGLSLSGGTLSLTGSFSGALLGITAYAAGSDSTLHTQSSNTLTDWDATNAIVTFTAPSSGNVLVELAALGDSSVNGDHYWGLRESTTTLATCFMFGQTVTAIANRGVVQFYLTGLSGGSHTYKAAHRVTVGTCHIYSGPNYGQVIIRVWEMP